MPYFIQFMRDLSDQVTQVKKETEGIKENAAKDKENLENQPIGGLDGFLFPGLQVPQIAAIMPAPGQGFGGGAFGAPQYPQNPGPGGAFGGGMGGFQ